MKVLGILLLFLFGYLGISYLDHAFSRKIHIMAEAKKNPDAQGSEIWIKGIVVDGHEYKGCEGLKIKGDWIKEDGYLKWRDYDLEYELSPEIVIDVPEGSKIKIIFQKNSWRGIASIAYGNIRDEIDTYTNYSNYDREFEYILNPNELVTFHLQIEAKILYSCIFAVCIMSLGFLIVTSKKVVQKNERIVWLDILKIIASYSIVVIHLSGNIYNINYNINEKLYLNGLYINCITRFAVPCFIMVSGITMLSKEKNYTYVINKVKKLVLALFAWSIIYLIFKKLLWQPNLDLKSEIATIAFEAKNGHMWYIYQLIWLYILLPFIYILYHKTNEKQKIIFLCVALFIPSIQDFCVRIFTEIDKEFVPATCIKPQLQYVALVFLGKYLYDSWNKRNVIISSIIALIGLFSMIIATWWLSLKRGYATHELFFELRLPALIYGIGVYLFALSYAKRLDKINIKIKKIVAMISDSLLGVYLGHCLLQWLTNQLPIDRVSRIVVIALFQFIVCILISSSIKRIHSLKRGRANI